MICKRCGKCCTNPIIALHNISFYNDKQELGRWLKGHGCEPIKLHNGKEEILAIKISSICKHLEEKNGIKICNIYDIRPNICKSYWCKEIINKEVQN